MTGFLFLLGVVAMTLAGDYLLKLAAMRPDGLTSPELAAAAVIYALSAVGWLLAMRHLSLAAIAVGYAMLMLILLAAMGVLFFGERLAPRESLGLVLACVSIGLMARFH